MPLSGERIAPLIYGAAPWRPYMTDSSRKNSNTVRELSTAALRMLIVEDSADDAALLVAQLARAGRNVAHRRVDTAAGMRDALREAEWDVVISDHVMPAFSSAEALQVLRQSGRSIPFIIYSGCISEQVIENARRDGVSSCIVKGRLGELMPAMERELRASGIDARPAAVNLVHLADYDRVTGLPGRDLFMRQAEQRLAGAGPEDRFAVCVIDLARFMRVNQTFGYEAADRVLAQIARRLKTGAPHSLVSRFAGDKFAIVCGGFATMHEVQGFAGRMIDMLTESCGHEGLQLHLASSMGISVFPEDGTALHELMLRAETALFHCKKLLGRNSFLFHFKGMDGDAGRELTLESELWDASALSELFLLYQPIIALDTGKVIAMEALARWQHPKFGLLPPNRFIPLADENGMMGRIGEWVLVEACRQAQAWHAAGCGSLGVSVNVSASQFNQQTLLGRVSRALHESRLAPDCLTIEITESVLMRDADAILDTLRVLKKMGVRIAIDDFGTGYSSLSYLKQYPVDVLKIDQSFISGIDRDERDAAITRAIIDLGRSLGLTVLAEGVETAAQAGCLRAYGCDCVQGFFFSKPILAADVPAFVAGRAVDNLRPAPL